MDFRRRSLFAVCTIWLTAASTLFATSFHFECICPNGSRQPFCLSFLLGDAACHAKKAEKAASKKCCKKSDAKAAQVVASSTPKPSKPAVQQGGCEKSFVASEPFSLHRLDDVAKLTAVFVLPCADVSMPVAFHDVAKFDSSPPPIPPDRIILFQHFSI